MQYLIGAVASALITLVSVKAVAPSVLLGLIPIIFVAALFEMNKKDY